MERVWEFIYGVARRVADLHFTEAGPDTRDAGFVAFTSTLTALCTCKFLKVLHKQDADEVTERLLSLSDISSFVVLAAAQADKTDEALDEVDARFFIQTAHKIGKEDFLQKLFHGSTADGNLQKIVDALQKLREGKFHQACMKRALAGADAVIEEARSIIIKLEHTTAIPKKEALESIAELEFKEDFSKALGVLMSVPGKSLLHGRI